MLKYITTAVTFAEVPDEISLCINITGCPNHCSGCHSQFLWHDVGEPLTPGVLDIIIPKNKGISCICFMGGDQAPEELNVLIEHIKETYPNLKVAWYSGNDIIHGKIRLSQLNYIKIGPYIKELGGLDKETTNQKFYEITEGGTLKDITSKFWKNEKDI